MKLTLDQVVEEAKKIFDAHAQGAELDAGFDAGEFSGPDHACAEEKEVTALAEKHGFTYDQVINRMEEQNIATMNDAADAEVDAGKYREDDPRNEYPKKGEHF